MLADAATTPGMSIKHAAKECTVAVEDTLANVSLLPQPGKVGIDGRQHEMVDIEVIERLSKIFSQPTREEQNYRHELDINTTWFGVVNEANQPFLQYSNRIADILQESQIGDYRERFPHLVSFVGQTGTSLSPSQPHLAPTVH